MAAINLSEFLGNVLVALSEAQLISDRYSEQVRADESQHNGLVDIPNARFQSVKLSLKLAFAPQPLPLPEPTSAPELPPVRAPSLASANARNVMVYVDAPDLKDLPEQVISTLDLTLRVDTIETVELPPSP